MIILDSGGFEDLEAFLTTSPELDAALKQEASRAAALYAVNAPVGKTGRLASSVEVTTEVGNPHEDGKPLKNKIKNRKYAVVSATAPYALPVEVGHTFENGRVVEAEHIWGKVLGEL